VTIREVRPLRAEQDEVRRLISDLAEYRVAKVMRDDGEATAHYAPSLLDALREAVAVGGEATRMGASAPGSKMPIATDAADALRELERRVIRLQLQATQAGGVSIESRLQLIAGIVLGWSVPSDVAWAVRYLRDFVELVEATITPARSFSLRRPCPSCGVDSVQRVDDLGETVRAPALTVDDRNGAHCAACNLRWPPQQVKFLAEVIEKEDQRARQLYERARAEVDPAVVEAEWPEWEQLDEETRRAWREWNPGSGSGSGDAEAASAGGD
jgi:hypothetical protein